MSPNGTDYNIAFELGQIRPILDWAGESGVDVGLILERLGLAPDAHEAQPGTILNLIDYFRIQREIAHALDDLTAQLSERKLLYQTGSFVISQLKSAGTLQDTLVSLASHFNMLHGGTYNSVRQSGDTLTLVLDDSGFPYRFRDDEQLTCFVRDALIIKVFCLIDSLTDGYAQKALRRVSLVRHQHGKQDKLSSFWQVPVQHGKSVYELVFDYEMACARITPLLDADLSTDGVFSRIIPHLELLQKQTDTRSYSVRTEEFIAEGLETQQDVADAFGISVATLRRRLSDEQTSFRDLLTAHRMNRANAMLSRGASISQVSETLGYSDVRAFNRAFKKLRGMSPAVYARNQDAAHTNV